MLKIMYLFQMVVRAKIPNITFIKILGILQLLSAICFITPIAGPFDITSYTDNILKKEF